MPAPRAIGIVVGVTIALIGVSHPVVAGIGCCPPPSAESSTEASAPAKSSAKSETPSHTEASATAKPAHAVAKASPHTRGSPVPSSR